MKNMNSGGKHLPHVIVQFNDGAHSFLLPAGATFLELADRIDDLAAIHSSPPIAVHVDFDASPSYRPAETGSQHAYH